MNIRFWTMASCDEFGAITTIHSTIDELIEEYDNLRKEDGNFSHLSQIEEYEMDTLKNAGLMVSHEGRFLNITVHEVEIECGIKFATISD
jgi:hypothetical protein